MLVEGGADNANQCFLEASRFGSTELVHILLQITERNSLDVDVDLAMGFASHYGKIGTMEYLVEEGNAMAFLGPLMRAAERGCILVVEWFVQGVAETWNCASPSQLPHQAVKSRLLHIFCPKFPSTFLLPSASKL